MTKLNRKLEYALMALKHMTGKWPGQLTTAKEVSDHCNTPFDATSRVMQMMAQKGLLKSEQGAHGGYLIVRDLEKVSFLELSEIILGRSSIAKCIQTDHDGCDLRDTCNIQSPVASLNSRLLEFYRKLSVLELLQVPRVRPASTVTVANAAAANAAVATGAARGAHEERGQ